MLDHDQPEPVDLIDPPWKPGETVPPGGESTGPAPSGRPWLIGAALALTAVVAIGVIVALFMDFGDGGADESSDGDGADPADLEFVDDIVAGLGVDDAAVVDAIFDALLPGGLGEDESAALVSELANLVAGDAVDVAGASSDDPTDVLVEATIRRLGPAAAAGDLDDLLSLLVAQVDPEGTVSTPDELRTALTSWLESTSAITLTVSASTGAAGAPALDELDFEAAVALLEGIGLRTGFVGVSIDGVDGIGQLGLGAIDWEADAGTRTITLYGQAGPGRPSGDAAVWLTWGTTDRPVATLAVRTGGWRLTDAGVSGSLGDHRFESVTFVVTEAGRALAAALEPALAAFVERDHGAPVDGITLDAGLTVIGTVPRDAIPRAGRSLIGRDAIGISASLGPDFGPVTGGPAPSEVSIVATAADLAPPALPGWLIPVAGSPWRLTIDAAGSDITIGLNGQLDADLAGTTARLDARVSAGSGAEAARLGAELARPMQGAFGLEWLDIESATLTVALDNSGSQAELTGLTNLMGRAAEATATFAPGTAAEVSVSVDRLDARETLDFVAGAAGLEAPNLDVDLILDDVTISARAGDAGSVSIAASSTVFDQRVDTLVSAIAGDGVALGIGLDAWALAEALPALRDTAAEAIEFPASTLVYSTIDRDIPARDLTPAQAQFFGNREVRLRSGLSVDSRIDLTGTALEAPLEALGFDGAELPLSGTIPAGALGGSTSGSSASLDALALRIDLPDIDTGGSPEWLGGGRLGMEITSSSFGLVGNMNVVIDGQELAVDVLAAFVREPLGYGISLSGTVAGDEPWEQAFGVEWLTLEGVAVELSISPIGNVGLGFAGTAQIGAKDIDAAIKVELSAAGVPTNFILAGSSAAGLAVSDIMAVHAEMASAVGRPAGNGSGYPDLAIRDADIKFAPKGSEALGVEQGFAVAGDAFISVGGRESRFGVLDVSVTEAGVFASGELAAFQLGPLAWSDITLDLGLSPDEQRLLFDGLVELFGLQAGVEIDVSNDSVFFSEAIDDIRDLVELFEQLARDPVGTIERLPELFRAAGAPVPEWADAIADGVAELVATGATVSEAGIDAILNGRRVELAPVPRDGVATICPLSAKIEIDGTCFRTPPTPAIDGIPDGGTAKRCPATAPRSQGGDCYRLLPDPCGPREIICDPDGSPNGGTDKVCGVETPIEVGSRCYTTPPIPAIAPQPPGGVDRICPVPTPLEEDGRCYTLTPTAASAGIGFDGICAPFDVSCSLDDLISRDVARILADAVAERLPDW